MKKLPFLALSLSFTLSIIITSCSGCKVKDVREEKTVSIKTVDKKGKTAITSDSKVKYIPYNESGAIADATARYPDHEIRGSLRGDSIQYITADSKSSHSLELLVVYTRTGEYIKTLDLRELNPYRDYINYTLVDGTYQQMLGNNMVVEGTKEKIKGEIPSELYKLTPSDFYISAINPYINYERSPDHTKLIIRYGYHLLPAEEILEHQTYPGINTYVVIDINTGEELSRIENLAFIPYYEVVSDDGKYLIVAHTQDMRGEDFSTKEDDWKHQASVYSMTSGNLCFRIEGNYECTPMVKAEVGIYGLSCYNDNLPTGFKGSQDTITEYTIFNQKVISRLRNWKEGLYRKELSTGHYEVYRNKDKELFKYTYDKDFKLVKELCK